MRRIEGTSEKWNAAKAVFVQQQLVGAAAEDWPCCFLAEIMLIATDV